MRYNKNMEVTKYRLALVRESAFVYDGVSIAGPEDAVKIAYRSLHDSPVERLIAILLSTGGHVIGVCDIGLGDLSSAIASPASIAKAALLGNASSVILAHNHPSGDPTPSLSDISVNNCVTAALELFDIELLDSLVIGDNQYSSTTRPGERIPIGPICENPGIAV